MYEKKTSCIQNFIQNHTHSPEFPCVQVCQGNNPFVHMQSAKRRLWRSHRTAALADLRIHGDQVWFSPCLASCQLVAVILPKLLHWENHTTDAPKPTEAMGSLGLKSNSVQDFHLTSASDSAPGRQIDSSFVPLRALS